MPSNIVAVGDDEPTAKGLEVLAADKREDTDIADGTSSDDNGNGIPDECESGCTGDYNADGITNVKDLLFVIAGWNNPYDVNDLLTVIADWGCTSP